MIAVSLFNSEAFLNLRERIMSMSDAKFLEIFKVTKAELARRIHEPPEGSLIHSVEFSTIQGRDPLKVNIRLSPLNSYGDNIWRMIASVKGVRHPYDKNVHYNYFGRAIMNPALLPAVDYLSEVLSQQAARAFQNPDLRKSLHPASKTVLDLPDVKQFSDGIEICITSKSRHLFKKEEAPALLKGQFDEFVATVSKAAPKVQELIEGNKDKQPPLNPDALQKLKFDAAIHEAWGQAVATFPKTMFSFRNGTGLNFQ